MVVKSSLRLLLAALFVMVTFGNSVMGTHAQEPRAFVYQQFENGLALSTDSTVYILVNPNRAYEFPAESYAGLRDVALTEAAPTTPGARQPLRAIGIIWRNIAEIRRDIGWAIGGEVPYMATAGAAMGVYISLPDSRTVKINIGVLSQPTATFSLPTGAQITAQFGVWTFTDAGNVTAPCYTLQRIQFAPGAYSGTVSGALTPACPEVTYVLRALAGQQMLVSLNVQNNVTGSVTGPLGAASAYAQAPNAPVVVYQGVLGATGDYYVKISQPPGGLPQNVYTIMVAVAGTPNPQATVPPQPITCDYLPRRVQFAPGAYDWTFNGRLTPTCNKAWFVLWARAGQRMTVNLTGGGLLTGNVYLPTGGVRSGGVGIVPIIDETLAVTGDYVVEIVESGNITAGAYTVTVVIF